VDFCASFSMASRDFRLILFGRRNSLANRALVRFFEALISLLDGDFGGDFELFAIIRIARSHRDRIPVSILFNGCSIWLG